MALVSRKHVANEVFYQVEGKKRKLSNTVNDVGQNTNIFNQIDSNSIGSSDFLWVLYAKLFMKYFSEEKKSESHFKDALDEVHLKCNSYRRKTKELLVQITISSGTVQKETFNEMSIFDSLLCTFLLLVLHTKW